MSPVTFTEGPTGRIEAFIGTQLVGLISPWRGDGTTLGKVAATYQMRLPVKGAIELNRPMTSLVGARRTLLIRLAEWHEEADATLYAPMIAALRAQAEVER